MQKHKLNQFPTPKYKVTYYVNKEKVMLDIGIVSVEQ